MANRGGHRARDATHQLAGGLAQDGSKLHADTALTAAAPEWAVWGESARATGPTPHGGWLDTLTGNDGAIADGIVLR